MLEGGLHAEDQGVARHAQVEDPPVEALVDAAVRRDRGDRVGGAVDHEGLELDLDAAELDALVVLELAGDGDEAALGEARDRVGHVVGLAALGEHVGGGAGTDQLDGAGLVAEDHELHLLLVADGLDPSGDGDGSVGQRGEVLDEGACDHEARV